MRAPAILIVSLLVASALASGLAGFTHAASLPGNIVYSVPITLTNQESMATPAPFQQMITVNSAQFGSYEASSLQNVAFFYSNGTIVPSWLESGNSNTATSTIYWLRLADGIPAQSSMTIYMGFATTTTNLMNSQTTGESSSLSSPNGKYDDGQNVFLAYGDFSKGLDGWTPYVYSGGYTPQATIGSVEMLGGVGGNTFILPPNSVPQIPIVVEDSWSYSASNTVAQSISLYGNSPFGSTLGTVLINVCNPDGPALTASVAITFGYWYGCGAVNPFTALVVTSSSTTNQRTIAESSFLGCCNYNVLSFIAMPDNSHAFGGYIQGSVDLQDFASYQIPTSVSGSVSGVADQPTLLIGAGGWSGAMEEVNWIVARAYPPSGIMPSVSVGTPTSQTSTTTLNTAVTVTSTITTTLTSTETIVSQITLPAITFTTQLPASTFTMTTTKVVTTIITPSSTNSQTASTAENQQGGGSPPPGLPQSAGIVIGAVLIVFIAFVLVRVVFWRRIKDIMERL